MRAGIWRYKQEAGNDEKYSAEMEKECLGRRNERG